MTDDMDPTVRRILTPRRSKAPAILIMGAIAVAYLCFSYFNKITSALLPVPPPEALPVSTTENRRVTTEQLDTLKLQIDESSRLATDGLNAQKADLQKLTDQISALVHKIDALEKAEASSLAHAEIRPDVSPSIPPRRRLPVIAVHRKPVPSRTTGPSTTGPGPAPTNFPPILGPQSGGQ